MDFNYEDKDKIEINDDFKLESILDNNNSLLDLNYAFTNKCYKILIKKNYSLKKPL